MMYRSQVRNCYLCLDARGVETYCRGRVRTYIRSVESRVLAKTCGVEKISSGEDSNALPWPERVLHQRPVERTVEKDGLSASTCARSFRRALPLGSRVESCRWSQGKQLLVEFGVGDEARELFAPITNARESSRVEARPRKAQREASDTDQATPRQRRDARLDCGGLPRFAGGHFQDIAWDPMAPCSVTLGVF